MEFGNDQQMKETEKQSEKETVKKAEEKENETTVTGAEIINEGEKEPEKEHENPENITFTLTINYTKESARKTASFSYNYPFYVNIVCNVENHSAYEIKGNYSFLIGKEEDQVNFTCGPKEYFRHLIYHNSGSHQHTHSYVVEKDKLTETLITKEVFVDPEEITIDDEEQHEISHNINDEQMVVLDGEEEHDDNAMNVEQIVDEDEEDEDEDDEPEAEDEDEDMEDDEDDDQPNIANVDHEEIVE